MRFHRSTIVSSTLLGLIFAAAAYGPAPLQSAVGAPTRILRVEPQATSLHINETRQFSVAAAAAPVPADLQWEVNGIPGGSYENGYVSADGIYSAPSSLPAQPTVTIAARSASQPNVSASTVVNLSTGLTFYVSTSGSNSNPGTITSPWRTIQYAAEKVQAGDTVDVRAGVYNEAINVPVSGSAAFGSITFQSYPNEQAVIDGTGLKVVDGQSGLFTITDQSYIVISGFEVRNFTSASDANVPIGIYLQGADANVQLLNNHVHNITTTARANANNCASDALGIAIYGSRAPQAIENLVISGNEVDHNLTGCSETVTLNGNVNNFKVTNNLIHDNNNIGIDAIGFEQVSPEPAYDQARNGLISGNTIYNITSYGNPDYGNQYAADGIYVDGGTNIIIERNTVHDTDLNAELASENFGHVTSYITLRNNLLYNGNSNGVSIGGYGPGQGGTDHCTIVNNTLFHNDTKQTGSGEFQIQWYATNNSFENNIVYAGPQDLFINNFTGTEAIPASVDYNLYYSTDAADAQWTWSPKTKSVPGNPKTYTGFSSYRAGTGNDAHSMFANPQVLGAAEPNLHVEPTSPAMNAGINLGPAVVGKLDFGGKPRVQGASINIGAFEQ